MLITNLVNLTNTMHNLMRKLLGAINHLTHHIADLSESLVYH